LAPADIVVVYLGVICRGRGIEVFIEAVRQACDNVHFVLVGFGALLDVDGLAKGCDRVHVHEAVPHHMVVSLVREADFGMCLIEDVSLSDRLCLPNKLFEYALAGVPVIASRLPEISRVVHSYGLGVCCDTDVQSIARLLNSLVGEEKPFAPTDLTDLGWEAQARRLVQMYCGMLQSREGSY
jgi:glycosyltransferase involved in cell wall biosynthesis